MILSSICLSKQFWQLNWSNLATSCNHCQLSLAQTSSDGFSENLGFDGNSWVKKSVSKRILAKPHDACMDEFQQFQFEVAFVDPCKGQVVCSAHASCSSNKTRLRRVCIAPIRGNKKKTAKKKISLPRVFIKLEQPRVCRAMLLQWCRVTLQNAPCQHVFHSFLGTGCLRIILLEKTARDPPPFSCWAHLFCCL